MLIFKSYFGIEAVTDPFAYDLGQWFEWAALYNRGVQDIYALPGGTDGNPASVDNENNDNFRISVRASSLRLFVFPVGMRYISIITAVGSAGFDFYAGSYRKDYGVSLIK